jgi:hypothetical protein
MIVMGQITMNTASPVTQVARVAIGCFVLHVAVKIGGVFLKILLGLALLGGAIWWFHFK